MLKLFKNLIRKMLLEILEEPAIQPKFKEFKKVSTQNHENSIYDIIENYEVDGFELVIEYADKHNLAHADQRYCAKTLPEFKKMLEVWQPKYPYFRGAHFSVSYKHEFGKQREMQIIINSLNSSVHNSSDIVPNVTEPILQWINQHPELLV